MRCTPKLLTRSFNARCTFIRPCPRSFLLFSESLRRRRLFQRTIRTAVLRDVIGHSRIDHARVPLLGLVLRVEHELDGPALRPERVRVKTIEPFVDRVALG